jgi:hypothetical protein
MTLTGMYKSTSAGGVYIQWLSVVFQKMEKEDIWISFLYDLWHVRA